MLASLAVQGIMEQTLAQIAEYALLNDLQIKNDPRIEHVSNGGSVDQLNASVEGDLDMLESAIYDDCMVNDSQDVIIFAGVMHLPKLEKMLREKQFSAEGINDNSAICKRQSFDEKDYYACLETFTPKMDKAIESAEQLELFIADVHAALWSLSLVSPLSVDELGAIE